MKRSRVEGERISFHIENAINLFELKRASAAALALDALTALFRNPHFIVFVLEIEIYGISLSNSRFLVL